MEYNSILNGYLHGAAILKYLHSERIATVYFVFLKKNYLFNFILNVVI